MIEIMKTVYIILLAVIALLHILKCIKTPLSGAFAYLCIALHLPLVPVLLLMRAEYEMFVITFLGSALIHTLATLIASRFVIEDEKEAKR